MSNRAKILAWHKDCVICLGKMGMIQTSPDSEVTLKYDDEVSNIPPCRGRRTWVQRLLKAKFVMENA